MIRVHKVMGSVLSSNMYIIFEDSTKLCWIIDIGDFHALWNHIPSDAIVKGVFLTHGHFDHIHGINDFCYHYPNAIIYTSEYGKEQLLSSKKNFSYYHDSELVYDGNLSNIKILTGCETIHLFDNLTIDVVSTKGHCESCLTYLIDNYIFTGDSFIPGAEVITKLPGGNKRDAILSNNKIKLLSAGRHICPGHDVDNWVSYFK